MKVSSVILAAILHVSAAAWAAPQASSTPAPQVPPAQQIVQNSAVVQRPLLERPAGMRLVKPPAPKPEKKTPEIKFRDFRTARDPYPAD